MGGRSLRIMQVNTLHDRGGAAQVAWNLHRAYQNRDVTSWLAVKRKTNGGPTVQAIPNEENRPAAARALLSLAHQLNGSNVFRRTLRRALHRLAQPKRYLDLHRGIEDFHYRGTLRLLELFPERPHLIHCHNLHGGYFDLRALSGLSRQLPVVVTLHDLWLLTGHCAQSFDCERWRTGCGRCPDLTISPAIQRDATAYNWRRKRKIYLGSQLYVSTPCSWLMQKVENSILAPAVADARVIPNGVDLSVFEPADKRRVRTELAIPPGATVLLIAADGIRESRWRDYAVARNALRLASERLGDRLLLIALGEAGPAERIGRAEVRFVPYEQDRLKVARYYQAADVFLHPARVDTFPSSVLEALACGTPVVATDVGGIPEQIRPLHLDDYEQRRAEQALALGSTGVLVRAGDSDGFAGAIVAILGDAALRRALSANAAKDAQQRFGLERQVDKFLTWYDEILSRSRACAPVV